jgi:uncharacterized phage protein (TIGR02218 family)
MKQISEALLSHMKQELTTLAGLLRITRTDNSIIAFTTHDRDLVVEGVTYCADGAFSPDKLVQKAGLSVKDFDVEGLLDSEMISENDLKAGLYDHARIDLFMCNWADLSQGVVHMLRGWLGEVALSNGRYMVGLRGFQDLLSRKVGEAYTPECRFCFGDARCGVNPQAHTVTGSVSEVFDRRSFSDTARSEDDGIFTDGTLRWTSGANKGASCEVNAWNASTRTFTLWLPLPYAIAVGDGYQVTAGCDKRFATCRARFDNALNFGGFPYLPGIGKVLDYPSA